MYSNGAIATIRLASAPRWSLFKKDTTYFGPGDLAFMLNYRVDDLDALLAKLHAEGVKIADERHQDENGRFAWITDPGVGAPDGVGAPRAIASSSGSRPRATER